MGTSIGALLLTLSVSLGQTANEIGQEEREFQDNVFRQWWGTEFVWKFDELPKESKVAEERVPYSGYIYPDTAGGTMSALRKYDVAFHQGRLLATSHEQQDTDSTVRVARQVTERFGLFGAQVRTYTVFVNSTPAWYGHCNGWTSAAIRHAEPREEVEHNGVVFTPADIKGLLAEIYMYNDPQMLAGDETDINPGVLHAVLANWLGDGSHPIGIEADPGKEKWNYPLYAYSAETRRVSPNYVEVGMNVTHAMSSRGEFQASPRIPRRMYFHYQLQLDDDGEIVGGSYYRDSARIDMLWVPLRPKPSGTAGNERGNPHLDVDEVLAIWRKSVPDNLRRNWKIVDPPNSAPVISVTQSTEIAENQTCVLRVTAQDQDLREGLTFVSPQRLVYSISGGADGAMFAIDAETGELSFEQLPDFERPTDADEDNAYEVEVTVEDGAGDHDARSLSVTVTDANDAPEITSSSTFNTLENQEAVLTVTYTDQDSPAQTLSCAISGGADRAMFAIDAMTGKLTLKETPDFEKPTDADKDNAYEVEVRVADDVGGTTAQLVRVVVTDANDAPVMISDSSAKAAEMQLAVFTISANDEDSPAQPLSFSIIGGEDRASFGLNNNTGELAFSEMPDFEKPADKDQDNVYEVDIQADDGAGGTVTQSLRIVVTDANDRPTITSDRTSRSPEGQLAAITVAAHDEDAQPQNLAFSIRGGVDRKRFNINNKTGELAFKQPPDFEHPADANKDNIYEVKVKVDDGAGGSSLRAVRIAVTDANDLPIITSNNCVEAAENQLAALTLLYNDEDSPKQTLTCSLVGGADRERFAIDGATGELAFKQALDFEKPIDADQDNVYEVEVKVDDGQGGSVTQLIHVTVTDVNERPTITYSPKVQENQKEVLTINVSDEDMSMQVITILLSGGADRKLFSIDPKTGDLAFKTAPDFENPTDADKDNIYEVEVKVEDGRGGTAVKFIRVKVTDVDELAVVTAPDEVQP